MKAAKTAHSAVKKVVIQQQPWILEPVLNPTTGKYRYKYHKKQPEVL